MNELLTGMSLERLGTIYRSLPDQVLAALDLPIARALNSRPSSIARRPEALKVKGLRSFLVRTRDDDVAGDILRGYLLGPRVELVTGFLDATGVPHENGQVEDEGEPAADKVPAAVAKLLESFEAADVHLYLQVAALQWPDNKGVAAAVEELSAKA